MTYKACYESPRTRSLCKLWSSYITKLSGRRFNKSLGVFNRNFSSLQHLMSISEIKEIS